MMGGLDELSGTVGCELPQPRDAQMRRTVAEFQVGVRGLTAEFQNNLSHAIANCYRAGDTDTFIRTVANDAATLEQKLTRLQSNSAARLQDRAQELGGLDSLPGAPGDLSRSFGLIDMTSLRASSDVTESLSILTTTPVGERSVSLTLLLHFIPALSQIFDFRPIGFLVMLIARAQGSPQAFVYVMGSAPEGSLVNVTLGCGTQQWSLQDVTNDLSHWGVTFTPTSSATTCNVTASGITGSVSTVIHIP